jgi:lipopolysaccharide/colanic/teichoic acid biosynthesis glycosyltransferase
MKSSNSFKRIFDLTFSILLIILTLPLQIIITLILIFMFRGNPFYIQKRGVTLNHPLFTIYKFRTIRTHEIKLEEHKHTKDIFLQPNLAVDLKPFARWLRKTGLDELPQIYNVFMGKMSFVGPRPLMVRDLEIMKNEFPNYYNLRASLNLKSGITGVWQIIGDRNLGIENLIGLDIFYKENVSFILDLKILFSTIPIVLFAKNSDAIVPRIDFIKKLFFLSVGEFSFDHRKIFFAEKLRTEELKKYVLQIPTNWWYASSSYDSSLENRFINPNGKHEQDDNLYFKK